MTPVATLRKIEKKFAVQDLISDGDLSASDLDLLFDLAESMKTSPRSYARSLEGRQLALIFEKPSLRTRVAFEAGMTSLGGHAIYLDHSKPRLGEREAIKDIARNLERWVDGIAARTFSHGAVVELAENASIPVINALTDFAHPCQAIADYFTLKEKFGTLSGLKVAFIGDGNNMCHSLMMAGAKLGARVHVATPPGFEPKAAVVAEAKAAAEAAGGEVRIFRNPEEAVSGAQAVYTDVWASMGQEFAAHLRAQVFAPYRVTAQLMDAAGPEALFMHCLPAHRGQEATDEVVDSVRSIVFDQAENRLHTHKALLVLLLKNGRN